MYIFKTFLGLYKNLTLLENNGLFSDNHIIGSNGSVYKKEQEIVKSIVRQKMETVYATKVPLKVDIGFGSNWLQAH